MKTDVIEQGTHKTWNWKLRSDSTQSMQATALLITILYRDLGARPVLSQKRTLTRYYSKHTLLLCLAGWSAIWRLYNSFTLLNPGEMSTCHSHCGQW